MRRFAIILALVCLPAAASAREWQLLGGSAMHVMRSSSIDPVATDDVITQGELDFGVELLRHVPIVDRLSLEVGWSSGQTQATDFELYQATLGLQDLRLGGRVAREVFPRVRLFARGGAGAVRGALTIASLGSGDRSVGDSDWAAMFYGGAGVDLAILQAGPGWRDPDLAFGFRLELGWQSAADLHLAAHPRATDPDAATISTIAAPLGAVDTSGLVVRVGFVGRF
jgi:hypothetical protein